jgi:hypothetical protein
MFTGQRVDTRSGRCSLDPGEYLLSDVDSEKRQRPHQPVVIRGDLRYFTHSIRLCRSVSPYSSFTLSFTEPLRRVREVIGPIMEKLTWLETAGLEPADLAWLDVLHQGSAPSIEGGYEQSVDYHHLIANMDLRTGRVFRPFYFDVHCDAAALFQEWANIKYVLLDPRECPSRPITIPRGISRSLFNHLQEVNAELRAEIKIRSNYGKKDVISLLEAVGWKIAAERISKDKILAEPPVKFSRLQPIQLLGPALCDGFDRLAFLLPPPRIDRSDGRIYAVEAHLEEWRAHRARYVRGILRTTAKANAVVAATLPSQYHEITQRRHCLEISTLHDPDAENIAACLRRRQGALDDIIDQALGTVERIRGLDYEGPLTENDFQYLIESLKGRGDDIRRSSYTLGRAGQRLARGPKEAQLRAAQDKIRQALAAKGRSQGQR